MTIVKKFCLSENNEDHLRLLRNIDKLGTAKKSSFSQIVVSSLFEYVEKETRLIQARIEDFKDPLSKQIDLLRHRFVNDNPERYPTWTDCLIDNELFKEEVIEYSKKKGWRIEGYR